MGLNRISNRIIQLAKIIPAVGATTRLSEDNASATFFVDFRTQLELLAYIHCAIVGTSVTAQFMQATASDGTGSKALTTPRITSVITVAETVAQLELRQEEANALLDLDNNFFFIGLQIISIGATTVASGEIYGLYMTDEDGAGPQADDQATSAFTFRQVIA